MRDGTERGGTGRGQGGSKKYKPIPALPHGVGLKSRPIPVPPPLQGGKNPHRAKQGGTEQNCHPYARYQVIH